MDSFVSQRAEVELESTNLPSAIAVRLAKVKHDDGACELMLVKQLSVLKHLGD